MRRLPPSDRVRLRSRRLRGTARRVLPEAAEDEGGTLRRAWIASLLAASACVTAVQLTDAGRRVREIIVFRGTEAEDRERAERFPNAPTEASAKKELEGCRLILRDDQDLPPESFRVCLGSGLHYILCLVAGRSGR